MAPAIFWDRFKLGNEKQATDRAIMEYQNPFGTGTAGGMAYWNDKGFYEQYGATAKVILHAWDRIDGIEIFYGGVSSGLRGTAGGTPRVLDVAAGEYVIGVAGNGSGPYITKLTIYKTDKDGNHVAGVSGGGRGGGGWAQGPDTFDFNVQLVLTAMGSSDTAKQRYGKATACLLWTSGWPPNGPREGYVQRLSFAYGDIETV